MMETKKLYEEMRLSIIDFPLYDVIRTSGVNSNGEDNDGKWDDAWDRE